MKNLILVLLLMISFSCNAQDKKYVNYRRSLSEMIKSKNVAKEDIFILIDKSEYKLTVRTDKVILKEYPVVFGNNPFDDKLMRGDRCTPEGTFTMISKYPHKKWSKFIWINYPNKDSWRKHNEAVKNGTIPEDAKIGGEVGIHGVPKGMDYLIDIGYNWTLGCISMKNKDVDELYPYITKSTIIKIQK